MTREEAIRNARELISTGVHVMATVDEEGRPQMRWMGALAADPRDENVHYIVSSAKARKVAQLQANPAVQLLFTAPEYKCIVNVSGECDMVQDMEIKRMVWDAIPACADYHSGPDDPDFGVIRFRARCLEVLCVGESHEPVRVELCG